MNFILINFSLNAVVRSHLRIGEIVHGTRPQPITTMELSPIAAARLSLRDVELTNTPQTLIQR